MPLDGIVDVGGWVAPAMELIYEQGTPAFRGQWPRIESMLELAAPRPGRGDWAHPALELPAVPSRRARRDAWGPDRRDAGGPDQSEPPAPPIPSGVLHDNSTGRLAALDDAGVALQLISPGPSIDACLQLHGGYGYMLEYPISRAYVDARVSRIYGGSNEIMLEIVGRSLGLGDPR